MKVLEQNNLNFNRYEMDTLNSQYGITQVNACLRKLNLLKKREDFSFNGTDAKAIRVFVYKMFCQDLEFLKQTKFKKYDFSDEKIIDGMYRDGYAWNGVAWYLVEPIPLPERTVEGDFTVVENKLMEILIK